MRAIHRVTLDKRRPAVMLTRESVLPRIQYVTVAIVTSTVRGLAIEVPVGERNGLDRECVINCDNVQLVHRDDVGESIGFLLDEQEEELAAALVAAYDLRV